MAKRTTSPTRHRQRGFTLLELMMVVAIFGIITMMAVPAFQQMIESERVRTISQDLYSDLVLARSEAIKTNGNAVIAPVDPGQWHLGWTVTGAQLVVTRSAYTDIAITTTPVGLTNVTYTRTGRISNAVSPSFKIASDLPAPDQDLTRCLTIDLSGLPHTERTGTSPCP